MLVLDKEASPSISLAERKLSLWRGESTPVPVFHGSRRVPASRHPRRRSNLGVRDVRAGHLKAATSEGPLDHMKVLLKIRLSLSKTFCGGVLLVEHRPVGAESGGRAGSALWLMECQCPFCWLSERLFSEFPRDIRSQDHRARPIFLLRGLRANV